MGVVVSLSEEEVKVIALALRGYDVVGEVASAIATRLEQSDQGEMVVVPIDQWIEASEWEREF